MSTFSARTILRLSSTIKPGPVTPVNGIQCPFRNKILLRPTVSSKTSTGNAKDGGLQGTLQLFRISQSTQTPQIPTQPVRNSSTTLSSLSLPTSSLGWDGTILPDLICLQSCCNKPVVSIEELSTPVDPAVVHHPPVTMNKHRVNLFATPPALEYQVQQ